MRKVWTLLFICFGIFNIYGQASDVYIKINHRVGNQELELEKAAYVTWNGVSYNFTRLQYYISGISIIHDGGQTTIASDVYLLANPKSKLYAIGSHDVQNIEKLSFHIGVNSKVNHGDPTLWPSDHPLSPQDPSMHWGWAAGYRFAAIEGNADAGNGSFVNKFEFHPIGDKLYTEIDLDVKSYKDVDGNIIIELNADYNKLFNTIDITGGMIMHGDLPPLPQFMLNFKDVFQDANATSTIDKQNPEIAVTCCNSASSALIQYSSIRQGISFNLVNMNGQVVYQQKKLNSNGSIQLPDPLAKGMYIMSFMQDGNVLYSGKVVIQK